jgi:hypothetical protein
MKTKAQKERDLLKQEFQLTTFGSLDVGDEFYSQGKVWVKDSSVGGKEFGCRSICNFAISPESVLVACFDDFDLTFSPTSLRARA